MKFSKKIILLFFIFLVFVFFVIHIESLNFPKTIHLIEVVENDSLATKIEFTGQDDIDEITKLLGIQLWEKVYNYDLKCSPSMTLYFNKNYVVEILCIKNKKTYIRSNGKYYMCKKNVLKDIFKYCYE